MRYELKKAVYKDIKTIEIYLPVTRYRISKITSQLDDLNIEIKLAGDNIDHKDYGYYSGW